MGDCSSLPLATLAALSTAYPASKVMPGTYALTTDSGFVVSDGSNWGQVYPRIATVSAAIGGSLMLLGSTQKTDVTVTGARVGMSCAIAPSTYPGDGVQWQAYVKANDTVTVVLSALIAVTPASTVYNLKVFA